MSIHIKKSHRGLLHKQVGIPEGKKIPTSVLESMAKSQNPEWRARAQFALNAKKWKH